MLSVSENELLTQVTGKAPMGDYIRRFWMPFLQSSDLPAPDGEPVRVKLMGEWLLAFRDSSGRPGLIQRNCPHRWADMFFGRNEEDGLRCSYHGWKFDINGECVDMPTETDDSNFKNKVRIVSYPVVEAGEVCWTYMGPKELQPELPKFEWLRVPESHRYTSWSHQENNYAQAVEGAIDSAHSNFLHATLDAYRVTDAWIEQGKRSGALRDVYHAQDRHPKFFAEDTDYGVMVGSRRETQEDQHYWRFNLFMLPFYAMPPATARQKFLHAWIPIDDYNCQRWTFVWNLHHPITAQERTSWDNGADLHAALLPGPGHMPVMNARNDYLIDREQQKKNTFTGIPGIGEQDFSVQEGMGAITPRQNEHLGTTDVGIIKMRRRLLNEMNALQEGIEPHAASNPQVVNVRATDVLLDRGSSFVEDPKVKELMTTKW